MPPATTLTVGALVRRGARLFQRAGLVFGHGLASARDEALLLTAHALTLPRENIPLEQRVPQADAARVLALFERRVRERKPAAYLTREAWLGDKRFYVDERVIVPRSFIAEILLDHDFPFLPAANRVKRVLDLCTGSGCLAILAAQRYRQAQVDATDISPDALAVAQINIRRHRLQKRVKYLISNYFLKIARRRYDIILSNPPYVTHAAMRALPDEYRAEPTLALAAGRDGLDALRVILAQSAQHLNPGGVLIVECGHARDSVERAWPHLPFFWPETSGGDDCVFMLTREELASGMLTPPAKRPVASRVVGVRAKA